MFIYIHAHTHTHTHSVKGINSYKFGGILSEPKSHHTVNTAL